eukprot:216190_1
MAEAVQKDLSSLNQKYETLLKEHNTLQQKYNGLQAQCNILNQRIATLTTTDAEDDTAVKNVTPAATKHDHSEEFWDDIREKVKYNPDYVKSLVRNGTISMIDMDKNKRTLLNIAAKRGSYDIVQLCLNLGADIDHKNVRGHSSVDYARGEGYYHIEQLLLFSKMKANLGAKVKIASDVITKQQAIVEYIINELSQIGDQTKDIFEKTLLEVMHNLIVKRAVFSDDLLNLCWDISCKQHDDPLKSDLYRTLSTVCTETIRQGNKTDWFWLKNCIIPSTIWYNEIQVKEEQEQEVDKDKESEEKKPNVRYLYYELLEIVDFESTNQLAQLQKDLNGLANEKPNEWKQLVQWDLSKARGVRQDTVARGIRSRYTYAQLLQYVTASFNAFRWNEFKQYLCELVLLAQMVDESFQSSVQTLFNINKITGFGTVNDTDDGKANVDEDELVGKVKYLRGPVKLLERCVSKAQNDYGDEGYPTTACVIDLNRCCFIFYDIETMLNALRKFETKVGAQEAGNIIDIARDKNGFKEYVKQAQYADIKLNVLIRGKKHNIIGEVQFLLQIMADFKHRAHALYSIQRNREYMDNCVSKILPSLLNEDNQIFTAGSRGSVKDLCQLLIYNKSMQDIMRKDDGQQTILFTICSQGHNNAYLYLKSIIPRAEFIGYLFESNFWNVQPIDYAIRFGNVFIVKDVLSMKKVQEKYEKEANQFYRLLYWLFVYCKNEGLIDDILRTWKVSQSKIIEYLKYEYPKPTQEFSWRAHHYHRTNIIGRTITFNTVHGLKILISKIGEDAFVDAIFRIDSDDKNGIEYAVSEDRLEIIEFVMQMEAIKQKCMKDKDALYRIVNQMKQHYNPKTAHLMLQALELNHEKLKELNSYKEVSDETIHKILPS